MSLVSAWIVLPKHHALSVVTKNAPIWRCTWWNGYKIPFYLYNFLLNDIKWSGSEIDLIHWMMKFKLNTFSRKHRNISVGALIVQLFFHGSQKLPIIIYVIKIATSQSDSIVMQDFLSRQQFWKFHSMQRNSVRFNSPHTTMWFVMTSKSIFYSIPIAVIWFISHNLAKKKQVEFTTVVFMFWCVAIQVFKTNKNKKESDCVAYKPGIFLMDYSNHIGLFWKSNGSHHFSVKRIVHPK